MKPKKKISGRKAVAKNNALKKSQTRKKNPVNSPIVSIIILNLNGLDFTRKCIDSVRKNTKRPSFEILVVDNGSKGEEVKQLMKMYEKNLIDKLVLNNVNTGFSGGNNLGMMASSGQYMLLLNNDTTVEMGWLNALVKVAEGDESIGIVGPNIVSIHQPETIFGGGFVEDSGIARHSFKAVESEAEQVGGAAFMFKREVFEKLGGLDEGFNPIYFEETDYCTRGRKAGYKVVFTPKSKVIHFEGGMMKKQPSKRQFATMNKNRLRYMLLHFSKRRLVKAVPFEVGRVGKSIVNRKTGSLFSAYWANLKNAPEILEKRQRYKKGDFKA